MHIAPRFGNITTPDKAPQHQALRLQIADELAALVPDALAVAANALSMPNYSRDYNLEKSSKADAANTVLANYLQATKPLGLNLFA